MFQNFTSNFRLLIILLFTSVFVNVLNAQIQVQNYTACPNQVVTVTATWPNVGNVSYNLSVPNGGSPASGALASNVFTISHSSQILGNFQFTLNGVGTSLQGQVASSATINLTIVPPAPLSLTNQVNYCAGSTATITAPPGGLFYNVNSTCFSANNLQSNVILIPNLSAINNCTYLITSAGSCTATGVTTINVSPTTPITVNSPSNVCQNGTVQLTANLPGGVNYQWYDPYGTPLGTNVSNVLLTGVTPNNSGNYTVTANLPFNTIQCPRTAITQVSVVSTNSINVSASPSTVLCQGDKLSFNAGASGAFGWSWSGPQSFNASIANPTINPALPLNSGTYTVTALFTNNVITCQRNAQITVSVITVNSPVITMLPSVCQNNTLSLSAAATGASAFNWYGPNNFSANSTNTVLTNIQTNASGIYYVSAIFSQNSTTCAATSSAQLNVVPVNTISIIPTQPVCTPNNAFLQASALGANQFVWTGPNGFNAPGPNATVYYPSTNATGIYTVTAFFVGNNISCSNTNTTLLTVNPILTFSLVNRQQACYNTSLVVNGPSGATGYTWTSSTGFTSNLKDIVFPVTQPNQSGTYTLNVSLGPCITTASTTIDILTPIEFTLRPFDRTVCSGDTVYLEIGASGGSQNYAYTWSPAVYIGNPIGPQKVAIPLSSVNYNILAFDIACPGYSISHAFDIKVNQPPKPKFTIDKAYGCQPLCMFLNSKTGREAAIVMYDFGGVRKIQQDSFQYCLDAPGIYSLQVSTTGTNGCHGIFDFPVPIEVFPNPGSSISWSPENPTTTDIVEFKPLHAIQPVIRNAWTFTGGSPVKIDTTYDYSLGFDTSNYIYPQRKYELPGRYQVILVSENENGCRDTVMDYIEVIDDFKVYIPNSFTPNGDNLNDMFKISGSAIKSEGFLMEIFDRNGNRIYMTRELNWGWNGTVGGMPMAEGTYIYKIKLIGMNGAGRREYTGHVLLLK